MPGSLADQLEPLHRHITASHPTIHPVLAIEAELAGADQTRAVEAARRRVLDWMGSPQRLGPLPERAWLLKTFEHMPGGNAAHAVRLQKEGLDYWIARCDLLVRGAEDGVVRTVTTEVSVVLAGGRGRFGCRHQVAAHERELALAPTPPDVVAGIAADPGILDGGLPIGGTPWIVDTADEAWRFIEAVERRSRRLPVIVVSLDEGETDPAGAAVDAHDLAKRTLGLARVVVLAGRQSFALTDRWGKTYACFLRAVRVYHPGFDPGVQSPYAHPLTLPDLIQGWPSRHGGAAFADHLVRAVAAESVKRLWSDRTLPTFATVRQEALRAWRREAEANKDTSADDLLAIADEELRNKDRRIAELEAALKEQALRAQAVPEEVELLRGQQYWLQSRVDHLLAELEAAGRDPDPRLAFPADYKEMDDWVNRHLSGQVFLTPRAARGAKNAVFEDVGLVYQALLMLGREYRAMRQHGGSARIEAFRTRLAALGLVEEPTGEVTRLLERGKEFLVAYDGRERLLERHLKNGGNARDPRRCFRLYFFYDEDRHLVVVGSLPAHLTTRAT
ncbi:MAG: hypothetical protein KDG89_16720 [Geminicoccaceae bacterium]|nr:hypothetical protein [Geminicoccaceae bacterium]